MSLIKGFVKKVYEKNGYQTADVDLKMFETKSVDPVVRLQEAIRLSNEVNAEALLTLRQRLKELRQPVPAALAH